MHKLTTLAILILASPANAALLFTITGRIESSFGGVPVATLTGTYTTTDNNLTLLSMNLTVAPVPGNTTFVPFTYTTGGADFTTLYSFASDRALQLNMQPDRTNPNRLGIDRFGSRETSGGVSYWVSGEVIRTAAVPEPATVVSALIGTGILALRRRKS